MSKQRRENMETELEKLRMVPSLHLFLPQLEVWVGRLHCSTSVSQIKYLKRRTPCTAKPWHGLGIPFPSPSYNLQWCAFEVAAQLQHLTEYPMPVLNWVLQRAGSLAKPYKVNYIILFIHIFVQFLFFIKILMLCCFNFTHQAGYDIHTYTNLVLSMIDCILTL